MRFHKESTAAISLAMALSIATACLATTSAKAAEPDWEAEITSYLWAVGIKGNFTVGDRTFKIDRDIGDVVEAVDMTGGLLTVGRYRHLVGWGQVDYLSLDTDEIDPSPDDRLKTKTTIGTVGLGYHFGGPDSRRTLDVLVGGRFAWFKHELTPTGQATRKGDTDVADPVVILRPSLLIGERWRFNPTFSYGTGGDSEHTWELQPQIQFQFNPYVAMRLGYRKVHYEFRNEDDGNAWHGAYQGVLLGIGATLGSAHQPPRQITTTLPPPRPAAPPPPRPAASLAPPPPPPPAVVVVVPPPDTDGDGIPDVADSCADTPRGDRVDFIGCGYQRRLDVFFATNSATLMPESYADLDRAVEILKRVPSLGAAVSGHTDSSGGAAYNLKLSQRRAQSVAKYLLDHGIERSRISSEGFGETQPIADNATVEGRAQNRRVVLTRDPNLP